MRELLACSAVQLLLPTLFLLRACEFMACSLLSSARPLVAAGYDAWILPSHTIANPTRRGSAAVLHPGVLLSRFRFCCAALCLARYVYCVVCICVRCGLSTPYLASVCTRHGLVHAIRQVIGGVLAAAFFSLNRRGSMRGRGRVFRQVCRNIATSPWCGQDGGAGSTA